MASASQGPASKQGDYLIAYYEATGVLTREQTYWQGIATGLSGTSASRAEAAEIAAQISQQLLVIDVAHNAIMDRYQSGMNPPSAATIKAAQARTEKLAKDIKVQTAANNIISLVTKFATAWGKI
jgi:hypothetical protein